jgi:membrane-associated phospholipid phosphatase
MTAQVIALGALAATTLFLFFPLNNPKGKIQRGKIVKYIPFIPGFVIPYVGHYPYIAFSMLAVLLFTPVAARLYVSLIFGGIIAALFWYFFPTVSADRPQVEGKKDILHRTIAWIYRMDPGGAAIPSSHTYVAVLCSYYLTYIFPFHETAIWATGATIVSSTLFVKQHHLIDLVAGIILAAVSIAFSYIILGAL